MKTLLVAIGLFLSIGGIAVADPAADLGVRFADVYEGFAPLYTLYQSYADHLFQGTEVEIPEQLPNACSRLGEQLAFLHLDLVGQTTSETVVAMPAVIHLRSQAAAFCGFFQPTIDVMDAWDEIDDEALQLASDLGLFVAISEMNDGLEIAFAATLDGFAEDLSRWTFAVAFSVRAIAEQSALERINSNLAEIFFGEGPDRILPMQLPEGVESAMSRLVDLSGRDLTSEETVEAREGATLVYRHLVGTIDDEDAP